MREATRQRLERALRMRRLRFAGTGAAMALAVGVGAWWTGLDSNVETHQVPGVVTTVGPLHGATAKAMEEGLAVDVKLDDGRVAHVTALKARNPHVGDRVEIVEHIHGTGRHTFSWE
jgi:hypothetical protein